MEPPAGGRPGRLGLAWFELRHGAPIAMRALLGRLGWRGLLRLLPDLAWSSLVRDPFRGLASHGTLSPRERSSRRQMRSVLLLLDALGRRSALSPAEALELVGRIVAETGARFIASNLSGLDPGVWPALDAGGRERLVLDIVARFPNAEASVADGGPGAGPGFDVHRCHFASLARALGRPEVAPLFCAADDAYFADPASPLALRRSATLASGGPRCDFRFTLRSPAP